MSPSEAFASIFFNSTPRQYAAAVGATLFALLIAAAMMPVAGGYTVYLVLPAAVAFSAVYCGLGPSVVAIAVALFGVRYWFINPSHSLSIPDGPQAIGILAFVVVSGVVVAIGEKNRRNLKALSQSQANLEERLGERTAGLDITDKGVCALTPRPFPFPDE